MKRLSPKTKHRFHRGFATSPQGRLQRGQTPRNRIRPVIEILEDRTVLSSINISNGNLFYLANSSGLTVSTTGPGGTYTFADNQPINLFPGAISAGWTVNGDTATGPDNSVSSIQLTTNETVDTITIQSVDAPTSIDSGAGNDVLNITANGIPSADPLTINNSTTNGSDADTLNIDTGGTNGTLSTGANSNVSYQAAGQGLISYSSAKPGFSLNVENQAANSLSLNINGQITSPTALDTTISDSSGSLAWITKSGGNTLFALSVPTSVLNTVAVAGTSAGETLTLDYSGGDPLPTSGLTYDPASTSGLATNSLTLQGGSFTGEEYTATGTGAGSILYDGTKTITFSNLSPVTDTVPSPSFIFTAPATSQTVNYNTGPIVAGTQTDQINDGGTASFELINLGNKTSVTVNVPDSGATTTVNYPTAAAGLSTLNIFSGAGGETVNVQTNAAGVTTTVDTGSVSGSTINVGLGGSLAAIDGPVFAKSTGGTNKLAIDDSAEASANTYTIAGSKVTATSFPSSIDFSGGGITTLNVTSAGHGDTFNFTGPVQSAVTTYNFSADGGAGPNTLDVNSSVPQLSYTGAGVLGFGAGAPVINYFNFQTINVTKPALPPLGTGQTISTTEGQALNNVVVATFTESDPGNVTSDFTASINWGDSTTSIGTIQPNGGSNGYNILGSHTYAAAGAYTVNVTLIDLGSTGSAVVAGTTINVTSNGPVNSAPNPIVSPASAAAAPLNAQGATVSGSPGAALTGVLVATFMDTGTPGPPSAYTASIDWGNGTTTAATSITSQGTPNGVVFSVFGTNTYASIGTYPLTVTITKTASGATGIASGQAFISATAGTITPGTATALSANTGVALAAGSVIGTFTDFEHHRTGD